MLIPPHPEWAGVSLAQLKTISGPTLAKLARDQGLTPSEGPPNSEQARIHNLNMILRHLGVSRVHLHPFCLGFNRNKRDSGPLSGSSIAERGAPYLAYDEHESLKPLPGLHCNALFAFLFCISRIIIPPMHSFDICP